MVQIRRHRGWNSDSRKDRLDGSPGVRVNLLLPSFGDGIVVQHCLLALFGDEIVIERDNFVAPRHHPVDLSFAEIFCSEVFCIPRKFVAVQCAQSFQEMPLTSIASGSFYP